MKNSSGYEEMLVGSEILPVSATRTSGSIAGGRAGRSEETSPPTSNGNLMVDVGSVWTGRKRLIYGQSQGRRRK